MRGGGDSPMIMRGERLTGKQRGGAGHRLRRVNIRLDPESWQALETIATRQSCTVGELITEIARDCLELAIQVYIVEFLRTDNDGKPGSGESGR